MKQLACALAAAAVLSGCAGDSSLTGPDDGSLPDVSGEAFIVSLGARTVGSGGGNIDTVPALYLSEAAGDTVPTLEVWFAPSTVRSLSGASVPESALTPGRKVRVWTNSPVLASWTAIVSADSIIVLN